jgi:hypothetical protein
MPNLRLSNTAARVDRLALGIAPRSVSLYPLFEERQMILWLDSVAGEETTLYGGTFFSTPDSTLVETGPTEITGAPTLEYSAVPTGRGELLVLWTRTPNASSVTSPLFAQIIDSEGRPLLAQQLARNGRYPRAVVDLNGTLHIVWLEPESAALWTVRYARFSGALIGEDVGEGQAIGIISTRTGQALESFDLGADATHVYAVWGLVTVDTNNTPSTIGELGGISFAIGDTSTTRTLSMDMVGGVSLRFPDMPLRTRNLMNMSITVSRQRDGQIVDEPVVCWLTPQGINAAQAILSTPINASYTMGRTALAVDADGNLHIAWSALDARGDTHIYYGTTRP